jgi:hypothetical protein
MKIDKILETIAFISGVERLYRVDSNVGKMSVEIFSFNTEHINAITYDGKIRLGNGSEYDLKNFVRTREEAELIAVETIKSLLDKKLNKTEEAKP